MMNNDTIIKCLELRAKCEHTLDSSKWVLCMLDGRSFSSLIKNKFKLPFDVDFINMMNETAKYLCEKISGVKLAYVQSDEISLVITAFDTPNTEPFFRFRTTKLLSIIASLATAKFNQLMLLHLLNKATPKDSITNIIEEMALHNFDCKVWNVDDYQDVYDWFSYRQWDNIRNSRIQAAQAYFPKKSLFNMTAKEQVALLKEKFNIDWSDYDDGIKFGRFVIRKEITFDAYNPKGETTQCTRKKWFIENGFYIGTEESAETFKKMIFEQLNTN